jgi:formyltetrahydrofolate hydrolase
MNTKLLVLTLIFAVLVAATSAKKNNPITNPTLQSVKIQFKLDDSDDFSSKSRASIEKRLRKISSELNVDFEETDQNKDGVMILVSRMKTCLDDVIANKNLPNNIVQSCLVGNGRSRELWRATKIAIAKTWVKRNEAGEK